MRVDLQRKFCLRTAGRYRAGFSYFLSFALLFFCSFALVNCGGKRRPPPVAPRQTAKVPRFAKGNAPQIRVLLKENFKIATLEGSALAPLLKVEAAKGAVTLLDGKKPRSSSGFRIEAANQSILRLDGVLYRGTMELFINPFSIPVIVNELDLEEYLKGVVPDELNPGTFPQLEAVKAQTIAARTFALSSIGQFASRGFDVYSDNRSQVYRGTTREHLLSNRAVDETRGVIAVYQKQPIVALYSSNCGGQTEDYQAIFRNVSIPYLRGGVKCPDGNGRNSSWNERIPISKIQPNLDRWARIGRLKKLVPLKHTSSKRIVEMRFVGEGGEIILKGNDLRAALGLRSNVITDLNSLCDDSGLITEIQVKGRGWGHGVGMCQIGAVEFAKQGLTFEQILKRYYLGVDLVRKY